jgi:hypothetical protein
MATVIIGASPHHSTFQGTTVDLKYLWSQWSKGAVTPQHISGYNCGPEILVDTVVKSACPHHTSTHPVVQLWTCVTSRPQ